MLQQNDLVGQTIGQYRIVEEIGSGGMAAVYKAWQRSLERHVAVKVLFPHLSGPEFVQRFQQEAIVAANLSHPNIVTIYEVGQQDRFVYIAMEYIDGRSLSQIILEDGAFPPQRLLHILQQVADALDSAHRRHFVHRDIKSANILVTAEDRAIITDFGIAKALKGSGATAQLTAAGTVMGTPAYMAPEQIQGLPVTFRADLYSLGIVCYEMLAGRPPFGGTTTAAILYAQVNNPPPSIGEIHPYIPRRVEKALDRMLSKRPEDRFSTAGAFVDELRTGLAAERHLSRETDSKTTPKPKAANGYRPYDPPRSRKKAQPHLAADRRRNKTPMVLGVAIVAVVVLLGLGILATVLSSRSAPALEPTREAVSMTVTAAIPSSTPVPILDDVLVPSATANVLVAENATASPLVTGSRILFISKEENNVDIWVMNADGSGVKNLTNSPSLDYWPRWSPDNARIAFHSYEPGQQNAELYVMNEDGTNWIRLTRSETADKFPDWSPDGERMVFASDRDGDYEIYVMDSGGIQVEALTNNPAKDYFPMWSPDGARILFDTDRDGNTEIYAVNVDGTGLVNLTHSPANDTLAAWSPDGSKIAFSSDRSGQMEIWVMDSNGSNPIQLTTRGGQEPRWSSDGNQIAFASERTGRQQIHVMNRDGSDIVPLTYSEAENWNPCWSR